MRGTAAVALLALVARAEQPGTPEALLARWADADPDARRHILLRLEEVERARRYADARPVLVDLGDRVVPVAEVFDSILDPALETPTNPAGDGDPGLLPIHVQALGALEAVREAYAAPRPVRAGTLNLFLGYGARALASQALPAHLRLRLFRDTMRNVRSLEGRVEPDAYTAFLIRYRLLPPLLAMARAAKQPALKETVSEAASLLFLPAILDERAQAQLAPLATGVHSRDLLERFYRAGSLDELGKISLARSVAAQVRDDPAFAAGAAPLMLELLSDPQLPPRDRGELCDVLLQRLLDVEALRGSALDLLAVAFGGPPRDADGWRAAREERKGPLVLPQGEQRFRFLSIVLVKEREGQPPGVARVVRRDLRHHEPLYADDGRGGKRFVGVLVPDARGEHADFLGPPPGLAAARDIRLLRRPLDLERVSVRAFGARSEEVEIAVTLPEDASEPVPSVEAGLEHVVALLDARLRITTDDSERCELVKLLAAMDTDASRAASVRHARGPSVAELIPAAERGDLDAARAVLAKLGDVPVEGRERALAAIAATKDLRPELRGRCRDAEPVLAALAAEALLAAGDAGGLEELLGHANKYARACAAGLAVRLTPLAGALRAAPQAPSDLERIAKVAEKAFTRQDGEPFLRLGAWLGLVLRDSEAARRLRREHKPLFVGERPADAWQFAEAYTLGIREGKDQKRWPALVVFLLDPHDPGAGITGRDLDPLLDVLEERAKGDVRRVWIDALVVLACVQSGMELDPHFAELADARLERVAGKDAPPRERRRPGFHWPMWAAERAK